MDKRERRHALPLCLAALIVAGAQASTTAEQHDFAMQSDELPKVWPLVGIAYGRWSPPVVERYVYVPKGERFEHTVLRGRVTAGGDAASIAVYVDGTLLTSQRVLDDSELLVSLPALDAGFHRIELAGHPTMLAPEHQRDVECPPLYVLPMGLDDLRLDHVPVRVQAPRLADLPDPLYNAAFPKSGPWIGAILMPAEPAAASAALKLASWLSASAGIEWVVGEHSEADFHILLRHDPQLGHQATLSVVASRPVGRSLAVEPELAATLTIDYRDEGGLRNATHALLNARYRDQLTGSTARIEQAVEAPEWATLTAPRTLSELGLSDLRLEGSARTDVVLSYPDYWVPTDIPTGHLIVRAQTGMSDGSYLNVWLDGDLVGSTPLAYLRSGSIQTRFPLSGARIPADATLGLALEHTLVTAQVCNQPVIGVAWVDAERSEISIPHRDKTGVMSFIPALPADPSVRASAPSEIQAALAIAAAVRVQLGGAPLPWIVTRDAQGGKGGDTAAQDAGSGTTPSIPAASAPRPTIALRVDAELLADMAEPYGDRLSTPFLERSVWLRAGPERGVQIVAGNAAAMARLGMVWSKALENLPDGVEDALLSTDNGTLIVLKRLPLPVNRPQQGRLTDEQLEYGVLTVVILFLLAVLLLFWRRRVRRRLA